jgi:hypothetical protein
MLELITVVFAPELPLLKIQAQSIIKYINNVDSITVIINDDDDVCNNIDTAWWGIYQDRVKIIPKSKWNYTSCINGWEEQQLLKLLAASESNSKWSMVLDAKTWFVQTFDSNNFFDHHGRPKTGSITVFPVFESSQRFIEQYYNISMPKVLGPAGVPFMFHTNTVYELINNIDNFIDFFQTEVRYPHLITEFHLYSGYILSKFGNYDQLYHMNSYYDVLNIADWEANEFDKLLSWAKTNSKLLTTSIHRRTYKLLSHEQIAQWVDFLSTKNLIQNKQETISMLNTL